MQRIVGATIFSQQICGSKRVYEKKFTDKSKKNRSQGKISIIEIGYLQE
jgi:hypothetical protein